MLERLVARLKQSALGDRLRPGPLHTRRHFFTALTRAVTQMIESAAVGRGGTAVDYGCGDAPYRELALQKLDRYVGVDFPDNPRADLHLGPEGELPFAAATVKLVLSSQVLEHVPSPQKYLAEARRVLTHDGHLLLSTHGVWQYHPHPLDLRRWTRQGLIAELADAGFAVVSLASVLGPVAAAAQLLQDTTAPRLPRPFRPAWRLAGQAVVGAAERLRRPNEHDDAAVYVVLAAVAAPSRTEG
jgi:SAM-dependent methyltransferase